MQDAGPTPNDGAFLDIGIKLRDANPCPNLIMYVSPQRGSNLYINGSYQEIENGTDHVGNKGPLSSGDF